MNSAAFLPHSNLHVNPNRIKFINFWLQNLLHSEYTAVAASIYNYSWDSIIMLITERCKILGNHQDRQ